MTSEPDTSRSRSQHAQVAPAVPHTDANDVGVDVDATVVPVGTFAAGQSEDGRYIAVTAAPQGSFAAGQSEEDEATAPEAAAISPEAPPSRAG